MGIQINGQTDIISATDGSLTVSGADLGNASASNLNISGIVTATEFSGNVTGNLTGTASTATAAATAYGISGSPTLSGISSVSTTNLTVNGNAYPSAGPLSNRNLIVNGNMLIDQRNSGTSTTPTTDGTMTFDRWKLRNATGTGRFSVQQSGVSPNSIDPSMLLTVTTTATPGTSEFYAMEQRVEGYTLSQAALGSSASKDLILSFWVRSSLIGTYCCAFRNSDASHCFVAEYSITSANTWEYKTISITARTSGSWNTTNGIGAYVDWVLGSGSGFEGSIGWQEANRVATSNQIDWISTSGATFYLTGVQLEVGTVATPFEHRSYGDELARCQRYFCKSYSQGVTPGTDTSVGMVVGRNFDTTSSRSDLPSYVTYPVVMRDVPAVTVYSKTGTINNFSRGNSSIQDGHQSNDTVASIEHRGTLYLGGLRSSNGAPASGFYYYHFTASAEL